MLHHVEGVGEFPLPHRAAIFEQCFQGLKQFPGPFQGVVRAFEFDPILARDGVDAEVFLQRLQIAGIVVEQLLRQARVLEMKGFGWHQEAKAPRRRAASSARASGTTVVLAMTGMKLVSPLQRGTTCT